MNYPTEEAISLPIPAKFRKTALKFASEQPTREKAKQVYLNTLAVQVVYSYLDMLDVPASLDSSYSWGRATRLVADVADLFLLGVGHLECRPIRTGSQLCSIPHEVWDNRIGYMVVEINQSCQEAHIKGFLPHVRALEINVSELQPLSVFIDYLHQSPVVELRQWLEGIYAAKWESIELQKNRQLAFRYHRVRGFELNSPEKIWQVIEQLYPNQSWENLLGEELLLDVKQKRNEQVIQVIVHLLTATQDEEIRWTLAEILWTLEPNHSAVSARRILDLGIYLAANPVGLMVAILPKQDGVAVLLRVYPMGNLAHLPSGLELAGLYANGQPFLQVQARENKDDYIQLKFCAEFGERFQVRVSLENGSIIESFVI